MMTDKCFSSPPQVQHQILPAVNLHFIGFFVAALSHFAILESFMYFQAQNLIYPKVFIKITGVGTMGVIVDTMI